MYEIRCGNIENLHQFYHITTMHVWSGANYLQWHFSVFIHFFKEGERHYQRMLNRVVWCPIQPPL